MLKIKEEKKELTWDELPVGTIFADEDNDLFVKVLPETFMYKQQPILAIPLDGKQCRTMIAKYFTILEKGTLLEVC